MNRRDKLVLAGVGALLVGLGTAAALMDTPDEVEPVPIRPTRLASNPKEELPEGTKRLLDKALPPDEIPQEFREAENYLESRWGHMGDSGLVAPGILPEGDMYFQDRRIITGVRGNGKPIFAKAFLRPEKYTGATVKSGHFQGLERNPRMTVPELSADQLQANVDKIKRKTSITKKAKDVLPPTLDDLPGGGYRPRGEGTEAGSGQQ
jgi:hypothetical protein